MEPTLIFVGVLAFSWLTWIFHEYVAWRQYRVYKTTTKRPSEIVEILDEKDFEKSRLYKIDKAHFSLINSIYSQVEHTVRRFSAFFHCYKYSVGLIVQSCVFLLITALVEVVISLPWDIYDTFVIEERHGFNKQTFGFYVKDQLKKFVVTQAIMMPIVSIIIFIVQAGGNYFFVYAWIFMSVAILFMMTIYPEFIAPLFDKYEPLPEGELKTMIEALASRLEFPLKKLYVVEGSKRSSHSNAYMYGFWKNKRIVLFDTLLAGYKMAGVEEEKKDDAPDATTKDTQVPAIPKGCSNEEVVAVLGHELGHWKLGHTLSMLAISEINILLMLFGFATVYTQKELYDAFGFVDSQPTLIGLMIVFQYVFAPYSELLGIMMTLFTRYNEFGADRFSAELGYGEKLCSSLIKLTKDNLSFPVNDWLYSWLTHSHPPVVERIRAIRAIKAKSD
ncbi:unnamed protein product [Sphagnum balticum]